MGKSYPRFAGSRCSVWDQEFSPAFGRSIWQASALLAQYSDPRAGVILRNDFDQLTIATNTIGGWAFTAATSGSIAADTTNPNGVLAISAGAVTANQGVNWQLNQVPFKLHPTKTTFFEARVQFTGLSSLKIQFLAGLAAISTAHIAAGAVGTTSKVAFDGVTTTGVIVSDACAAATSGTGTGFTIVNDTWYNLGIVATTAGATFYVDGVPVSTLVANIPTVAMAPVFVVQANATVTPVVNLDFLVVAGPRS